MNKVLLVNTMIQTLHLPGGGCTILHWGFRPLGTTGKSAQKRTRRGLITYLFRADEVFDESLGPRYHGSCGPFVESRHVLDSKELLMPKSILPSTSEFTK